MASNLNIFPSFCKLFEQNNSITRSQIASLIYIFYFYFEKQQFVLKVFKQAMNIKHEPRISNTQELTLRKETKKIT